MSDHLFSRFWPRIAYLKPALQGHVSVERQVFRGEEWVVIQDRANGQHHRLSGEAWSLISNMDGSRTLDEIWQLALVTMGDQVPDQGDVMQLLTLLYRADLLSLTDLPDLDELAERIDRQQKMALKRRFGNPLAVRIPVWNPELFLTRTYPLVKRVFSPLGMGLYGLLIVAALIQLALSWSALMASVSDRLLAAESLIPLFLTYPLVKFLHELGHGYTVKHWGGQVRQLGIMLLVFFPVPYVDASDSARFPDKRHRALVGAAGILVELGLAALAMLIWARMEPGIGRGLLFNVMVISGVSTVLFNGNPLLKFDGYYVLSDLIEIPNLGPRGSRYFQYVLGKFLGVKGATNPAHSRGEARWLLTYPILSFCYRITIITAIALLLVNNYFLIGVALALWALFTMFLRPVLKGLWFVYDNQQLEGSRRKAVATVAGSMAVVGVLFGWVPMPLGTTVEGVVWLPETALVRAGVDGMIETVAADDKVLVEKGHHILQMSNPLKLAQVTRLEAMLEEMQMRRRAMTAGDRAGARVMGEQIVQVRASLVDARNEYSALTVISPGAGQLVLSNPDDAPGRYVRRGDVVAYVLPQSAPIVRVVIPEDRIDMVRNRFEGAQVRASYALSKPWDAVALRQVAAATNSVPSPALSVAGGGSIVLDPSSEYELTSLDPIFVLDLALRGAPPVTEWAGARVFVRFDHGFEPVGARIWRALRLLFLRELNV